MNKYLIDKAINEDRDFFGFKLRTRHKFYDEKIINSIMDESINMYRLPEKLGVVVDIGANIGCVSLMAARNGATVYAFEPADINYDVLVYNIKKNGYSDKVKCIKQGVGEPGETKLFMHSKNSGAISSYNYNKHLLTDTYQVCNFISIKDVFKIYNIDSCDLLKLDCEGSEEDIIKDFDEDLAKKVKQISLEIHGSKHIRQAIKNKLSQWYTFEQTRSKREFVFTRK